MLKSVFSILSSQETGSSSVSSKMIFGALQFELFRFKIRSLGSKILKFPEFNLGIFSCCEFHILTFPKLGGAGEENRR